MEMLKIMDLSRESMISDILEDFPEAMPKFQELGMHSDVLLQPLNLSNRHVQHTALIPTNFWSSSKPTLWHFDQS